MLRALVVTTILAVLAAMLPQMAAAAAWPRTTGPLVWPVTGSRR
jgi:hypothetical protein